MYGIWSFIDWGGFSYRSFGNLNSSTFGCWGGKYFFEPTLFSYGLMTKEISALLFARILNYCDLVIQKGIEIGFRHKIISTQKQYFNSFLTSRWKKSLVRHLKSPKHFLCNNYLNKGKYRKKSLIFSVLELFAQMKFF